MMGIRTLSLPLVSLLALAWLMAAGCNDSSSVSDGDASALDVVVVDDGGGEEDGGADAEVLDDGSIDDGSIDDGSIDDGSIDDGSIDDGSVEPIGCTSNLQCGKGQFCLKEACSLKGGVCTDRPSICKPIVAEVCGCDGVTYDSQCAAHAAGVNVDFVGACSECETNLDCGLKNQYCAARTLDENSCSAPGSCEVKPTALECESELPVAVCGCDGKFYSTACHAAAAGVRATLDATVCEIVIDPIPIDPIITFP